MLKLKFVLFFITFCNFVNSQTDYEFFGVIKLNGDEKSMISYRLVFEEKNGYVQGYSITDLDGVHETKNVIEGTYDSKKNELSFREKEILYTKSKISPSSFCFINFLGKVKLSNTNSKIDGDFKGLFKNKEKCIDGTLTLAGIVKIERAVQKLSNKIEKTNRIDQQTKERVNPMRMLDSLKINKLNKGENLNVFWDSDELKLSVWDAGRYDGDIINLYHNDIKILNDYKISSKKDVLNVKLNKGINVFKIEALNEGDVAPNTSHIRLEGDSRVFDLMANIKKGETTQISILKKEH